MEDHAPKGKRFSHVYIERGEPTADSARMRHRLASLLSNVDELKAFGWMAIDELGVTIPYVGDGAFRWRLFLEECELKDVLDIVSLAYRYLSENRRTIRRAPEAMAQWRREVSRILAEENVSYRLDEDAGVHFAIDGEFESNRAATIAILGSPRYANVRTEFEAGLAQLPENGKAAIRGTFTAAEGLFRLMFASAPRLGSKEIEGHLGPALRRVYTGDTVALRSAPKLLGSFKEWVDAAHFYRHEAGKEEVASTTAHPRREPGKLGCLLYSLARRDRRWWEQFRRGLARSVTVTVRPVASSIRTTTGPGGAARQRRGTAAANAPVPDEAGDGQRPAQHDVGPRERGQVALLPSRVTSSASSKAWPGGTVAGSLGRGRASPLCDHAGPVDGPQRKGTK